MTGWKATELEWGRGPRVFEMFFSTKPGGTGIGLALCQRIIEEHRGTIALDSAPEHGTTMTITLPSA